jgi:hypothetical protein
MAMPMLTQDVFGEQQMQPGGVTWMSTSTSRNGNQSSELFGEFSGIAPGHYTLRQFAQQGDESHSASVDLATDQTVDFTSASVSGVDVSGKVAMASGAKLPDRTSVMLMPASGGQNLSARADADGRFDLHSVAPGSYELQVRAPGASIAVAQMAANGAEVQGSHLTVATDQVLVAATLATGSTSITGYAKSNGKAIGGVMILLVPRNPNAGHQLFRRDQSNTDGSFTLTRVVPGNYTLVAIENGWTLDWAQPEVIAPYLAGGLKVQVKGEKSLDLTTAVEVEPR